MRVVSNGGVSVRIGAPGSYRAASMSSMRGRCRVEARCFSASRAPRCPRRPSSSSRRMAGNVSGSFSSHEWRRLLDDDQLAAGQPRGAASRRQRHRDVAVAVDGDDRHSLVDPASRASTSLLRERRIDTPGPTRCNGFMTWRRIIGAVRRPSFDGLAGVAEERRRGHRVGDQRCTPMPASSAGLNRNR